MVSLSVSCSSVAIIVQDSYNVSNNNLRSLFISELQSDLIVVIKLSLQASYTELQDIIYVILYLNSLYYTDSAFIIIFKKKLKCVNFIKRLFKLTYFIFWNVSQ